MVGNVCFYLMGLVAIVWVVWGLIRNYKDKPAHGEILDSMTLVRLIASKERKSA